MKLTVNLPEHAYDLLIENGLLSRAGEIARAAMGGGRCVLITDSNVSPLYGEAVQKSLGTSGIETEIFVFPAGEKSKCFDTLIKIYSFLAEQKINRGDFIVALGGGVTGDITGFAAATYMRGVPYMQIPTTLLAQVDSSVGGKTAVDLPQGKNMVGSFYHPKVVLIDPEVLKTLPEEFFADGMAEVIKYGCIKDAPLFDLLCESNPKTQMAEIIFRCVDIKRQVVEQDEKDTGERMLLNFGHTLGHAIEKYYNYEGISHGMAVAVGMALMAKAGEDIGETKEGTAAKIIACLEKYALPTEVNYDIMEQIPTLAAGDKKNFGKMLNVILLKSVGEGFIYKLPYEELKQWRIFHGR